jgi:HEAT repeat protein
MSGESIKNDYLRLKEAPLDNLIGIVQSDNPQDYSLKHVALIELRRFPETDTVNLIRSFLDRHADNSLFKILCIKALSKRSNLKATAILCRLVDDPEWPVREEAARALGVIGDKRACTALLKKLQDINTEVRRASSHALAMIPIDAEDDIRTLINYLVDDDPAIRSSVSAALNESATRIFALRDLIVRELECLAQKICTDERKMAYLLHAIGKHRSLITALSSIDLGPNRESRLLELLAAS